MWRPNACNAALADPARARGRRDAQGPTRDRASPRVAAGLRPAPNVPLRAVVRVLRRGARAAAARAPGRHAELATIVGAARSRRVHRQSASAHDRRPGSVEWAQTRIALIPINLRTEPTAKPKRTILVPAKKPAARIRRRDTPTETAAIASTLLTSSFLTVIPLGTIFESARGTTSLFTRGTLIIVTRARKKKKKKTLRHRCKSSSQEAVLVGLCFWCGCVAKRATAR